VEKKITRRIVEEMGEKECEMSPRRSGSGEGDNTSNRPSSREEIIPGRAVRVNRTRE
jgi:hypothetical protein